MGIQRVNPEPGASGASESDAASIGPLPWVTAAWAGGLAAAAAVDHAYSAGAAALGLAAASLAAAAVAHRRNASRGLTLLCLAVAVAGAAAAWGTARGGPGRDVPLASWVEPESKLIEVRGRVTGRPRLSATPAEGLGRYLFDPPRTWFVLDVDRVTASDQRWRTRGRLLVQLRGADTRIRQGDTVICRGWLRAIEGPSNPGEQDFASIMQRRGVVGRLTLKSRGNVQWIGRAESAGFAGWREAVARYASYALHAGLGPGRGDTAAVLDALILGRRGAALDPIYRVFQQSGLAHVLSISGLHVGLLALGVWLATQALSGRPTWAAIASLIAVGLYVGIVPWRVPIVRAGLMTAGVCLALGGRWRMRTTTMVALIALVWLIARPDDLFSAGFQLSFGVVGGLILFAGPVADRWLGRLHAAGSPKRGLRRLALDRLGRYAIASLVAWAVATPLVAYHFGLVSIVALPLTLLALPVVAALLWLGVVKMVLGLVALPCAAWLAEPVGGLADLLNAMAHVGAALPGAWARAPEISPAWVIAALAVVVALFAGRFAGRPAATVAAAGLCVAWPFGAGLIDRADAPELTVRALAVGEGSCFVLESAGERWLFDAGSRSSTSIGRFTIVPALRALGIERLDTIVVSHADFDHYAAVLDVADAIPVGRVVTTARVVDEAAHQLEFHWAHGLAPRGATGYLLEGLARRGVPVVCVEPGWTDRLGKAEVRAIWPPRDRVFEAGNDNSLVMRFSAAGRRVMMTGDIQTEAMRAMQRRGVDIAADVCDLPHHGSYPRLPGRADSPAVDWLERVGPEVILQSCGRARLAEDPWARHLANTPRLITARHGMATVHIQPGGRIAWHTFSER